MASNVRNVTSPRYVEALFAAPRDVSSRVVVLEQRVKERWCSVVLAKFEYAEQIPCCVAGAFGGYVGYSLRDAKACVRSGFEQYGALRAADIDPISKHLFGGDSVVSQQLKHFGEDELSQLHEYPDAFMEVQERAFASCWERPTEGQHVGIKGATSRGMRKVKPAMGRAP